MVYRCRWSSMMNSLSLENLCYISCLTTCLNFASTLDLSRGKTRPIHSTRLPQTLTWTRLCVLYTGQLLRTLVQLATTSWRCRPELGVKSAIVKGKSTLAHIQHDHFKSGPFSNQRSHIAKETVPHNPDSSSQFSSRSNLTTYIQCSFYSWIRTW